MLSDQQKTDIKRRYYEKHSRCPKCNSKNLADTAINPIDVPANGNFIDLKNKTFCNDCQSYWYIDQLKS